jgi:hypothetical protein
MGRCSPLLSSDVIWYNALVSTPSDFGEKTSNRHDFNIAVSLRNPVRDYDHVCAVSIRDFCQEFDLELFAFFFGPKTVHPSLNTIVS